MLAAASMMKPMKRGDVTDLIAFRKIKLGINGPRSRKKSAKQGVGHRGLPGRCR